MAKIKFNAMTDEQITRFRERTGARGGKARARRHSKKQLRKWGLLGGRPQTIGPMTLSVLSSVPQTAKEITKKVFPNVSEEDFHARNRQITDLLSRLKREKRVRQVKDDKPYVKWVKA